MKIIGSVAVPSAMILPPRAMISAEDKELIPALALITVPASMVSVAPSSTTPLPLSSYTLSFVQVVVPIEPVTTILSVEPLPSLTHSHSPSKTVAVKPSGQLTLSHGFTSASFLQAIVLP